MTCTGSRPPTAEIFGGLGCLATLNSLKEARSLAIILLPAADLGRITRTELPAEADNRNLLG